MPDFDMLFIEIDVDSNQKVLAVTMTTLDDIIRLDAESPTPQEAADPATDI